MLELKKQQSEAENKEVLPSEDNDGEMMFPDFGPKLERYLVCHHQTTSIMMWLWLDHPRYTHDTIMAYVSTSH